MAKHLLYRRSMLQSAIVSGKRQDSALQAAQRRKKSHDSVSPGSRHRSTPLDSIPRPNVASLFVGTSQGARMLRWKSSILLLFILTVTADLFAQNRPDAPDYDVKEHYTKYEYRIAMRDGVHLFTSVYVPKDTSHPYPFLIDRTPYSVGPYGVDLYRAQLGPSPDFDKAGYIFVFHDVRGRYMSEGQFLEMRPHIDNKKSKQDVDDSSDLYDTIDWLLKYVTNNNGNAGIWRRRRARLKC